jgi:protein arginine N-methyltransferase 1
MFDYHRELLADETRTFAFRDAIARVVRPGDVVVDLGCGSGILSFFACQAGAAKVYAIDNTYAADFASFLTRHLGFADRIVIVRGHSTEVEIPERADVLVTETLGALGLDESIASLVRDARQRMLKPDARIIPAHVTVSMVPVELESAYAQHVGFWSKPRYGLDLRPLRVFASNAICHTRISTLAHLAEPADILSVDLANGDATTVTGRASFVARRNAQLHGFGVFFMARLAEDVLLTNCDWRTSSWSQGFLPLEEPVPVPKGERVELEVESQDGRVWGWRGTAAGAHFEQTTWLAKPPKGP